MIRPIRKNEVVLKKKTKYIGYFIDRWNRPFCKEFRSSTALDTYCKRMRRWGVAYVDIAYV